MDDKRCSYIDIISNKLISDGFKLMSRFENEAWYVFRRKRFEFSKISLIDTFVIIKAFPELDEGGLRRFSTQAFSFAEKAMSLFPPCGFFGGLECYPLAVVNKLDDSTISSLKNEVPPKHMAATEIPAVYLTETSYLAYFEGTPFWGAAYWEGRRRFIRKFFS